MPSARGLGGHARRWGGVACFVSCRLLVTGVEEPYRPKSIAENQICSEGIGGRKMIKLVRSDTEEGIAAGSEPSSDLCFSAQRLDVSVLPCTGSSLGHSP